jgi:hypothetical protein
MKNTSFLKVAYWAGAIADLTFGLLMIAFPSACLRVYGINIVVSPEIRFWMAYAGIAIFTWTAFLIWGLRQLEERKFIAIATAFVVLGFVITQIVGIFFGTVSAINMVPLLAMQFILIALLLIGYRKA